METLLVASAVLDCGAVAGIGWLLKRSARERDTTLAAQRAALAHLREDVAQLVRDAEERTRGLAAALDARERRLRALIAETAASRPAPAPNPERPAGESTSRAGMDPAEARLRRDLEQTLPGLALPRETGTTPSGLERAAALEGMARATLELTRRRLLEPGSPRSR